MRWLVKSGIITKTQGKVRGSTDLKDVIEDVLTQLGIAYEDPCCPSATNAQPVSFNPVTGQLQTNNSGTLGPVTGTTQTLTGAGAVSLTTYATLLVTTGSNAITLAAGADGQRKLIKMITHVGDASLTFSSLEGGTTATFNAVADFLEVVFLNGKWNITANNSVVIS